MHQFLKCILFGVKLCMFRTVCPSVIRSLMLYIVDEQILLTDCYQADSSICLTYTAVWLLASRQQFDICLLLYVQF